MRTLGFLLIFALNASGALSLGPERMLTPPRYAPAFGSQAVHALASDGTDFLAVWSEHARGREGIYVAVMSEQGVTRPTPSRPILRGLNLSHVFVVWTGNAYQMVWHDGASRFTMTAQLDRDGQLISQPVVIATLVPRAMAWNGRQTLVVLVDDKNIRGVLLGPAGIERPAFLIASVKSESVSAAPAGSDFVVVWAEMIWEPQATTVRAVRVPAEGAAGSPVTLLENVPYFAGGISTASDGERIGVAFYAGTSLQTSIRRYTLDADTLAFTAYERIWIASSPQVIATPDGLMTAYLSFDRGRVELMVVPFSNAKPRAIELGPRAGGGELRLASNGRATAAIWRDTRHSPSRELPAINIVGTTLDANVQVRTADVVDVAIAATAQTNPAIAPAGDEALVVWVDQAIPIGGNIVAMRVDAAGNPLAAQPLLVAERTSVSPMVVFTGELWIVVWAENDRTFMRRIARNGVMLDAAPVSLGTGLVVDVAANSEIVVMVRPESNGSSVVRLSRSGEAIGAPIAIEGAFTGAIASNGREFLLVWEEGSNWRQFPSRDLRDIRALRLDAAGAPMDAAPIDIATGREDTGGAHVGSDGTDFLIAYEHVEGYVGGIRTKRLLRNGTLDGVTAQQRGALLAENVVAAGITKREQGGYIVMFVRYGFTGPSSAWVVPVDARGVATDGPSRLAKSDQELLPAAVASSGTHTWAAYAKTEPRDDVGNVARVFVRAVDDPDAPSRRRTSRH